MTATVQLFEWRYIDLGLSRADWYRRKGWTVGDPVYIPRSTREWVCPCVRPLQ